MPKQVSPDKDREFILNFIHTDKYICDWFFEEMGGFNIQLGFRKDAYVFNNEEEVPSQINDNIEHGVFSKEYY